MRYLSLLIILFSLACNRSQGPVGEGNSAKSNIQTTLSPTTKKPTKQETIDFIVNQIADYNHIQFESDGKSFICWDRCGKNKIFLSKCNIEIGKYEIKLISSDAGIYHDCTNSINDAGYLKEFKLNLARTDDPNNAKLLDAFKHLVLLNQQAADSISFR